MRNKQRKRTHAHTHLELPQLIFWEIALSQLHVPLNNPPRGSRITQHKTASICAVLLTVSVFNFPYTNVL